MIKPGKNAHFLSDLLKKVDEMEPGNEVSAQVNSSFCLKNKIAAFTLAEVLVTLGIIGIVAAMTIPSLMSRYKTFVLQQQFKKVYAALSVAVEKTQFDLGEYVKCYYNQGGGPGVVADCLLFNQELVKQFNVIQTCEGDALKKGCLASDYEPSSKEVYVSKVYGSDPDAAYNKFMRACGGFSSASIAKRSRVDVFNGGFLMITYSYGSSVYYPLFLVDINGKSGPNKWGHDLFSFNFIKKKANDPYFTILPAGCSLVEKGGFTAEEMIKRISGTANY